MSNNPYTTPVVDDDDWRTRALCAQTDPEAFFPEKGGIPQDAKKVCETCEVRQQCLEYALSVDERHGVWGGLSTRQRDRIKRESSTLRSLTQAQTRRKQRDERIAQMSRQGIEASAIAAAVGVAERTVHRVLAEHGPRSEAPQPAERSA